MDKFIARQVSVETKNKKYLMGILNVTPDSFSDGGKYFSVSDALNQAEQLISDGADIIDVGAVSTRPFSEQVSAEEEWRRLKEIIPYLVKNFSVPVSVDTFDAEVARKCLDCGVDIINDVSGAFLSDMAEVIKKYNCGWIIMHGGVAIRKAEEATEYKNGIINDINVFFDDMLHKIKEYGIPLNNICLDPGFGFSKNSSQNIELLENLEKINKHGLPLLCALSRKRFIGELSGIKEAEKRDEGTLRANITACSKGADILRVHNVKLHKQFF